MDFRFSEDQESIRELARKICETEVTEDSLRKLEADGSWLHEGFWRALGQAELLGTAIPAEYGGAGMGLLELGILLEEQGRVVAPAPLLPSLVMGALPVARFGTDEQKNRILREVASGDLVLTAALAELDASHPHDVSTAAERVDTGWRITGMKACVPAAHLAHHVLVPARCDDGIGIYLVDMKAEGVTVDTQLGTGHEPLGNLSLDGAFVANQDVLVQPGDGEAALGWLLERTHACMAAVQLGIAQRQLEMLAEYATRREQFGQPIGAFQAVSQRAGDAYINVQSMRVTLSQALWRLSEELDTSREVMIARYWASEGGHQVAAAAQHIHGGMGVDCDYPLHRYTLLAKQLELSLGGASRTLGMLGSHLAAEAIRTLE